MRKSVLFVAGLLLLGAAGCAHRCGYADISMTVNPVHGGEARWRQEKLLIVSRYPTAEDPVLTVAFQRASTHEQEARKEFRGLEVSTPYEWTASVVKPILPVSLVLAVWMPWRHPHSHDADVWGMGDYLRDFVAWLNPFEAFPSGAQQLRGERVLFRVEEGYQAVQRFLQPLPDQSVRAFVGFQELGSYTTDRNGDATIDLREVASRIPPEGDVVVRLESEDVARRVVLSKSVADYLRGLR